MIFWFDVKRQDCLTPECWFVWKRTTILPSLRSVKKKRWLFLCQFSNLIEWPDFTAGCVKVQYPSLTVFRFNSANVRCVSFCGYSLLGSVWKATMALTAPFFKKVFTSIEWDAMLPNAKSAPIQIFFFWIVHLIVTMLCHCVKLHTFETITPIFVGFWMNDKLFCGISAMNIKDLSPQKFTTL